MKDYYKILELSPQATQQEVKQAYRRLVKAYHPDVAKGVSAVHTIQEINEAYSVLNHPQRRSRYDWLRTNPMLRQEPPVRRPQRPPHSYRPSPRSSRMTERELVKPYLKYTTLLCKISLLFCLLLALDYALPLQRRSDELRYLAKVYKSYKGRPPYHDHSELHTLSGKKVSVSKEAGDYFSQHPQLLLASTPMLGKVRWIAAADAGGDVYRVGRSIYGNFIFLPILLLIIASLGLLPSFPPEARFSFGVVSGTLLLICFYLVAV